MILGCFFQQPNDVSYMSSDDWKNGQLARSSELEFVRDSWS